MRWTDGSVEDACQSSGNCGNNRWDRIGCGDYYRAVYNDCAWEPQFDIFTEGYWWGVCTDNFQDWDCGSPGVVDADNYCDLVEYFFNIDPCDPGPLGSGCYLSMGGQPVTDATCIGIHEDTHHTEWQNFFNSLPTYCENQGYLDPLPIYCDDPNTINCQSAAAFFRNKIDEALIRYMSDKANEIASPTGGEYRARKAAEGCFHIAASNVCECAVTRGWFSENLCGICPP